MEKIQVSISSACKSSKPGGVPFVRISLSSFTTTGVSFDSSSKGQECPIRLTQSFRSYTCHLDFLRALLDSNGIVKGTLQGKKIALRGCDRAE